ncbi:MFS general substrate transporter [Apiospora rasikravindrae]|uniref:MFS general substrate transporter n=1 Tax=Apiospora rasikravindrae TaxID=990691 RepID=A0ABR1SLT0_9PEZI
MVLVLAVTTATLAFPLVFQIIAGVGTGLVVTTLLLAAQAALSEWDTALSTAVWFFSRSLGSVWGVSAPAAIFSSRTDALAPQNYGPGRPSPRILYTFKASTRDQVVSVFNNGLRTVWIVAAVITGCRSSSYLQ